jgi:hypothetical protein
MNSFAFDTIDVKNELYITLNKALATMGYTAVKVIKADPQTPAEIPCIGINRIDDSESNQSIDDSEVKEYNTASKELTTSYGTFFSEAMEIRIWHTNADEREKLYLAVKAILFAARDELCEKGLMNIVLRSGRDEQDTSMTLAPMALYWTTITMSYLNPLNIEFVDTVDAITSIEATVSMITEEVRNNEKG